MHEKTIAPRAYHVGVGHALLFGGVCAAIALGFRDALAWPSPTEPFAAHLPHALPLLGVRMALLCAALWGAHDAAWSRGATAVFAVVASCFLVTLAARGLLIPLALLSLLALTRLELRAPPAFQAALRNLPGRPSTLALAAALAAAAVFLSHRWSASKTPPPPTNPAREAVRWLVQDNPYRARLWARRWAGGEGDSPGEGALLFARIDWGLGQPGRARQTLQDVIRRSKQPALRDRAAQMLARIDSGANPAAEDVVR